MHSTKRTQTKKGRPGLGRWTLRILSSILALMLLLAGAGLIYQSISTIVDLRRFPPPGELVDVGGHKLHIQRTGDSGPAIILETGHGANSTQFALLIPELAKFGRVYAYDRAGYGWSEEGKGPWSAEVAADELHALLTKAQIEGPYILVSHSIGGTIHRIFANKYPGQVAGLVLLDPTAIGDLPGLLAAQLPNHRLTKRLAPFGVERLIIATGLIDTATLFRDMPAEQQPIAKALALTSKRARAALREFVWIGGAYEEPAPLKPELPLTVLSANRMEGGGGTFGGMRFEEILALQIKGHAALAAASAEGRHLILDGADHAGAGGMSSAYAPQIVDEVRRMVDLVDQRR